MSRVVVALIVMFAITARADEVDDLVARGEALAKKNEYTQAIRAFKEADAKRPRAAHACMIGLAYMRREAWPQAELFLARCERRAGLGDPPPDWIDAAHHQLAAKLHDAQIPAITIEVAPAGIAARLTVSSFAPDEVFEPQTIHLAPGKHVIEVTAPGYKAASREVTVAIGVPQTVSFTLEPETEPQKPVTPPGPPAPTPERPAREHAGPSKVPWVVIGAGAAIAAIGGIYDLSEVQPARDRLALAETVDAYRGLEGEFRTSRNVAIGLIAGGAIIATVGVVLKLTVFKAAPQVSASIDDGGGTVLVGWRR